MSSCVSACQSVDKGLAGVEPLSLRTQCVQGVGVCVWCPLVQSSGRALWWADQAPPDTSSLSQFLTRQGQESQLRLLDQLEFFCTPAQTRLCLCSGCLLTGVTASRLLCVFPHALRCCRGGAVRACTTHRQQIREEARKQQEELERILEENKKRVEAAQAAAAAAAVAGQQQQQQQPTVGSGAASAAGSGGGVGRATSAGNPLLQRPSVRSGGGMILVE